MFSLSFCDRFSVDGMNLPYASGLRNKNLPLSQPLDFKPFPKRSPNLQPISKPPARQKSPNEGHCKRTYEKKPQNILTRPLRSIKVVTSMTNTSQINKRKKLRFLSAKITPEMHVLLSGIAKSAGVSVSDVARFALSAGLETARTRFTPDCTPTKPAR